MKKIKGYVAGKLNDDAVGYIQNTHAMIKTARALREESFAVYETTKFKINEQQSNNPNKETV